MHRLGLGGFLDGGAVLRSRSQDQGCHRRADLDRRNRHPERAQGGSREISRRRSRLDFRRRAGAVGGHGLRRCQRRCPARHLERAYSRAVQQICRAGSRETVILNSKPYLGREGIYVPGYVQDQYGIKKATDLADPEKAKLFDSDGDGKGEWWAGAVGWEATNHSEVRAKSYGFDKYFTATTVEQNWPVSQPAALL